MLKLIKTCEACPEQYDLYLGTIKIAYLRLRHGYFYASIPDVNGTIVYEAYPEDSDGFFTREEVRERHLTAAIEAALKPWIKEAIYES